jgi:hypothetical protein
VLSTAQVAHEALALEVIFLLLETPSADSVEVAVAFVKEVGAFLQDISPQALNRYPSLVAHVTSAHLRQPCCCLRR